MLCEGETEPLIPYIDIAVNNAFAGNIQACGRSAECEVRQFLVPFLVQKETAVEQ